MMVLLVRGQTFQLARFTQWPLLFLPGLNGHQPHVEAAMAKVG